MDPFKFIKDAGEPAGSRGPVHPGWTPPSRNRILTASAHNQKGPKFRSLLPRLVRVSSIGGGSVPKAQARFRFAHAESCCWS